jgi:hypothetical protein
MATQQDSTFVYADVSNWAASFGWSVDDAAEDLGLTVTEVQFSPPSYSVTVADSSDQAKRNRNRAKAILILGGH